MDKNHFKYALFHLVQSKLKMNTFPPQLSNQTIMLYNSINPELFRGKKISEVLPAVATVIADRIKNNNLHSREGLSVPTKPNKSRISMQPFRNDTKKLTKNSRNDNPEHNININSTSTYITKSKDNKATRLSRHNTVEPDVEISNMTRDELVEEKKVLDKQIQEINARLSLPFVSSGDDHSLSDLVEPDDIRDTMKTLLNINAETDNDKYMAASFVIDENRELTQFEKSDIQINSFLGINDLSTLQMLFNPESLYVRYYVVMDSNYRLLDNTTNTISRFKWNYADSLNLQDGFVNSAGSIRDVIGMRLYQPRIPYSAAMVTTAKRVSVLIEEFGAQAFIGENGRRFHFLMRPNFSPLPIPPTSIEISTEDYNDGMFHFRKPITTFDSLTVSFGDPLDVIEFTVPFDRFFIAIEFTCYKSDK
jgi:hypothetical protein